MGEWTRHPGNPVISPAPAYYISHARPLPLPSHVASGLTGGTVDCRDLITVPDPSGKGWSGFYAARVWADEGPEQAVIATVHTTDLIHWKHLPPAFAPRKYNCIEVPDVFFLNGCWYMTCLTGHYMGSRGVFTDPYFNRGTIYAVADRPEGPYREFAEDNTRIGGNDGSCGYSCRSVVFQGERLELFTQPCPNDSWLATFSPPYTLRTSQEGYLRLGYCDRARGSHAATLIEPGATPAITRFAVQPPAMGRRRRRPLADRRRHVSRRGPHRLADRLVVCCGAESRNRSHRHAGKGRGGRVGVRVGRGKPGGHGGGVVALDAREACVLAGGTLEFEELHRRRMKVEYGRPYRLHVCIRRSRFDVFVDGDLMLQFGMRQPVPLGPRNIGLFVDRADGCIRDLAAYAMEEP